MGRSRRVAVIGAGAAGGDQLVEVVAEHIGLGPIADGVVAAVAANRLERARVRVAARAEVQLFRPALLGVETAEEAWAVLEAEPELSSINAP